MSRLSKTLKTSLIAAASSAVLLIAPTSASASEIQYGGNWGVQIDPAGQGCYAWTNWTSNTVTGRVYEQSDAETCYVEIQQYVRGGAWSPSTYGLSTNTKGQTVTVPGNSVGYYYYGPSSSGYLCVDVWAESSNARSTYRPTVIYGSGC